MLDNLRISEILNLSVKHEKNNMQSTYFRYRLTDIIDIEYISNGGCMHSWFTPTLATEPMLEFAKGIKRWNIVYTVFFQQPQNHLELTAGHPETW